MKITYDTIFTKMSEIIYAIDHNVPFDILVTGWAVKVVNKIIYLYNKKQSRNCLTNYELLRLFILYVFAIRLWGILHYAQGKITNIDTYKQDDTLIVSFRPKNNEPGADNKL